VTITASVMNIGGTAGTYDVVLTVNNVREGTQRVFLMPGSSGKVDFAVTRVEPGTYQFDINGVTGSFSVEPEPPSTTPATSAEQPPPAIPRSNEPP